MSDDSRQNFLNKIRVQKDLEQATGSLIERHGRGAELISKFAALDGNVPLKYGTMTQDTKESKTCVRQKQE